MNFEISLNSDDSHKKIRTKGENLIALPENYTVIDIETTGLDQILYLPFGMHLI